MALDTLAVGTVPWTLKGELILNCNCTVFCPCVVSLGKHPPTEGHCQTWGGVRIDEGQYGDIDLSGLNIGLLIEIPGNMGRGNWKVAIFVDDRASDEAYEALVTIFSGAAKGTTGLFTMLVGEFLGAERQPITYETEGKIPAHHSGAQDPRRCLPCRRQRPRTGFGHYQHRILDGARYYSCHGVQG